MAHKPIDLYDSVVTQVNIECKCRKECVLTMVDEFEALEILFKEGWRATPKYTYCPDCAKKYLTQPKPKRKSKD